MSWQASYFSVAHLNPLTHLESWLHPFAERSEVNLRGRSMQVLWTRRADRELSRRQGPLYVEMQLYYTCVVKKRVVFHDRCDLPVEQVDPRLSVSFRMVQSTRCDPREFAEHFPVQRELAPERAKGVGAKRLLLDFRRGGWEGEFEV